MKLLLDAWTYLSVSSSVMMTLSLNLGSALFSHQNLWVFFLCSGLKPKCITNTGTESGTFYNCVFNFFLNHGRKTPKYKSIKSNLRGHVLQQASIQHIHVPVGNISFNLTATAVAPERLLRLGAVKLFYLGFFKCSTSFFHLGNNAWEEFNGSIQAS